MRVKCIAVAVVACLLCFIFTGCGLGENFGPVASELAGAAKRADTTVPAKTPQAGSALSRVVYTQDIGATRKAYDEKLSAACGENADWDTPLQQAEVQKSAKIAIDDKSASIYKAKVSDTLEVELRQGMDGMLYDVRYLTMGKALTPELEAYMQALLGLLSDDTQGMQSWVQTCMQNIQDDEGHYYYTTLGENTVYMVYWPATGQIECRLANTQFLSEETGIDFSS